MKKTSIILGILCIMMSCVVHAYAPTGHPGITRITFIGEGRLLSQMTSKEIEQGFEKMGKGKFFGWKDHYFYIREDVKYVGEVLFSKVNASFTPFTLDYQLEEVTRKEVSTRITGSISGKVKGDIKKAQLEGAGSVTGEHKNATTVTKTEVVKMRVTIAPNSKLTYQVTGEGVLSNGLSRYYAFGIRFKQGSWEYVDIKTEYYEMIEELVE